MIALVASGCLQSVDKAAQSDNRTKLAGGQDQGTDTGTGTGGGIGSESDDELTDESTSTSTSTSTTLTYWQDTRPIIDEYCATCHQSTPTGGAPDDFAFDHYDDVGEELGIYSKRERMLVRIESGGMPVGATLPVDDKDKLVQWLRGGAPEGTPPVATPTAAILNPDAAAELPVGGQFEVKVAFENVPDGAYYDLLYSATSGATTGGTPIVSDTVVTTTTVNWDTSGIATIGDYYVYLELYDGDGTKLLSKASTGSVHVDNTPPGNDPPTVALTGIANGSDATLGTVDLGAASILIPFTKSDPENDPVGVTISYSPTGTDPFTQIVFNYQGDSPYEWQAFGILPEGTNYRFKIVASDGENQVQDVSDGPIGFTSTNYTWSNQLHGFCDGCHPSTAPAFDASDIASVANHKDQINTRVQNGEMPDDGPLIDSDKAKFQLWLWQGATF